MRAIEKIARVDDKGIVTIETGSQFQNKEVRVLILIEDELDDEATWYKNALKSTAFDFLKNESEDVYTINDGKPFAK